MCGDLSPNSAVPINSTGCFQLVKFIVLVVSLKNDCRIPAQHQTVKKNKKQQATIQNPGKQSTDVQHKVIIPQLS